MHTQRAKNITPERWQRIEEIYHAALERAPADRESFLGNICGTDSDLRREVESLLSEVTNSQGLLDRPAMSLTAESRTVVLESGSRLGPYEIERLIGEGGMGKVYRASDTRLGRTVAIKISSARFSERFEREARAIATLNHPHICHLYDVGPDYLVMEYIEGSPLKGPLPVEEALKYAEQVCEALDAAHSAGIVHRDLKPGNILLSTQGTKLLDFGLAQIEAGPGDPTITQMTQPGGVMGTPGYMAPEQWEGKRADARSDIYAIGCVLCEMLTGKRATDRAALATLELPTELRRIVLKLLEVEPERRYQSAADVIADLKRMQRSGEKKRIARYRWIAAAGVAALAIGLAAVFFLRPNRPPGRDQWVRLTNFPDSVSQPALSPDGRMLTFVRGPETFLARGEIYLKMLPNGEPVQLTHDGLNKMSPIFSPDGSRIAYSAGRWDTWDVSVISGQPRLWLKNASGLVWIDGRRLLFSEDKGGGYMGIVSAGETREGEKDIYLPPTERGMAHRSFPSPDGKSSLVVEMDRGIWLPCRFVPLDTAASAVSVGHPVGPPGARCTFAGWSRNGKWMYFSSSAGGGFHIWRQRYPDGQPEQITSGPSEEEGFALFPDGRSFVSSVGSRQSVVWMHDAGGERQISLEGYSLDPRFTPDGKKLCYRILKGALTTADPSELRVVELETGHNEPLMPGLEPWGAPGRAYDISRDGGQVVAAVRDQKGKSRLWVASIDRQSPPRQIPNVEGDSPFFGKDGEIFFREVHDAFAQGYRVRNDGTGLRKVSDQDIRLPVGVSPDGEWLVVAALVKEGESVFALPLSGASAVRVLFKRGGSYHLAWSPDQSRLFVSTPTGATATQVTGRTYIVPLKPGTIFPASPDGGFQTAADLAKLPGVRIIDAFDATPGDTPEVYAFSRASVLRNLYRIPIP